MILAHFFMIGNTASNSTEVKWFIFRKDCFDNLFTGYQSDGPQVDFQCFLFTYSKIAAIIVLILGFLLKLPQIEKILRERSVEGLSS